MTAKLQRLPWLFVLAPAVVAASLAWRPVHRPVDWAAVAPAILYAASIAAGYVFVRRLRAVAIEIGWTLIGLQSLIHLLDAVTASQLWDPWIEAGLAASGSLVLAAGLFRSHLLTEGERARRAEEQLRHDADHDSLTALANRSSFLESLALRWNQLEPASRSSIAVLFIDIDALRSVNGRYGKATGDELLKILARRLRGAVRERDIVARIGGDEFAALITGLADNEALDGLLARVHRRLTRKVGVSGLTIMPRASIGIARGSERHERPKDLLRAAEAAMFAARRAQLGSGPIAAA